MNLRDQLEKLLKQLKSATAARDAIVNKTIEEERSMSDEEVTAYDNECAKVKAFKTDIDRIETLIAEKQGEEATEQRIITAKAAEATAVKGASSGEASASRANLPDVAVNFRSAKEAPGVAFAKFAKVIARSKGNLLMAERIATQDYAQDKRIANIVKAAVAAGTTTSGGWAEALVGDESAVFADFVEFLRPMTIVGRFGANGIPGLRQVPFRVPLVGQTSGGEGYWVGEGKAKPLTKFDYERRTLEPLKVANIAVLSEEAIRYSSPSADLLVRDALADALRARMDVDFINPAKAAVADVSPASILNGVSGIPSTGVTAENVRMDLRALFQAFITANNSPTTGVFVMRGTTALALSLMMNALGQPEFPTITMNGGSLNGIPVIVSEYTPSGIVALVNASDIYVGDEGGIQVDMSREASLEMNDAPTSNSGTPTPAQLVSLWQTNSVGMRAERIINWARRRASGVAYLTDVDWGGEPA